MKEASKYIIENLAIAVADDHDIITEGLKCILKSGHVRHVDTFHSGQALLNAIASHPYDVYVMDISLNDIDGVTLVDEIRMRHSDAHIIVNTMRLDFLALRQMVEQNVDGGLYDSEQAEELCDAIESAMNGQRYFSPELKSYLKSELTQEHPSLREIDVLKAIARGLTSKEIAEHLFISENTVEAHRKNLFFKLKARNIADLIVKAISRGYINPTEI